MELCYCTLISYEEEVTFQKQNEYLLCLTDFLDSVSPQFLLMLLPFSLASALTGKFVSFFVFVF